MCTCGPPPLPHTTPPILILRNSLFFCFLFSARKQIRVIVFQQTKANSSKKPSSCIRVQRFLNSTQSPAVGQNPSSRKQKIIQPFHSLSAPRGIRTGFTTAHFPKQPLSAGGRGGGGEGGRPVCFTVPAGGLMGVKRGQSGPRLHPSSLTEGRRLLRPHRLPVQ